MPKPTRSLREFLQIADEVLAEQQSPGNYRPKEGADRRKPCGCRHAYRHDPPGWDTIFVCPAHQPPAAV